MKTRTTRPTIRQAVDQHLERVQLRLFEERQPGNRKQDRHYCQVLDAREKNRQGRRTSRKSRT